MLVQSLLDLALDRAAQRGQQQAQLEFDPHAVVTDGKAKAVCGASVGAGARVAIASTNGALGPAAAAGGAGGASLGARYQVGLTLRAYAAGDIMTVLLDPGQIV